jgi:nitroreductase
MALWAAAYFMIAARAYGLDCGPMSGFDAAKVDQNSSPMVVLV